MLTEKPATKWERPCTTNTIHERIVLNLFITNTDLYVIQKKNKHLIQIQTKEVITQICNGKREESGRLGIRYTDNVITFKTNRNMCFIPVKVFNIRLYFYN